MRSKRDTEADWAGGDLRRDTLDLRARIQLDLEQRGVALEFCRALSERLEPRVARSIDDSSYESLLDGVAAAYGVHCEATEAFASQLRDLAEIERLMSTFGSELSKLDEVLSVLAAHVERMRAAAAGHRVLH